jgi:hypothetical protein
MHGNRFLTKYLVGSREFTSICAAFNHDVTVRAEERLGSERPVTEVRLWQVTED